MNSPKIFNRFLIYCVFLIPSYSWSSNEILARSSSLDTGNPASGALPITLKSFTVSDSGKNNLLIEWVTASEQNNRIFLIERQTDTLNENWEIIDSLLSKGVKGNSQSELEYSLIDENLPAGTYYYRLTLINNTGDTTIHPDVEWGIIEEYESFIMFNSAVVWLDGEEFYQVFDTQGRKVQEGTSRYVNLQGKSRGVYIIKKGKMSTKFLLLYPRDK